MLGQLEERLGALGREGGRQRARDRDQGRLRKRRHEARGVGSGCSHPPCKAANAPCLPANTAAGNTDAARLAYGAGIKRCLDALPLWVAAARLEERGGNVAKARALLEQVGAGR